MGTAKPSAEPLALELSEIPAPTVLTQDGSVIVAANEAFCRLLGATRESLLGAPLESVLNGRGERIDATRSRHVMIDDAGARRWIECVSRACSQRHEVRCFTDLSEFESRRPGRSAVLSGLDGSRLEPETGVLTRLVILQELDGEISRSRRYGNPLSALLLRVRSSTLGTAERLRDLVRRVNQDLRWVDSLGRVRKDTFLLVLPETDEEGARQVAAKLRAEVEEHGVQIAAAGWHGTESAELFLHALSQKINDPLPEAV